MHHYLSHFRCPWWLLPKHSYCTIVTWFFFNVTSVAWQIKILCFMSFWIRTMFKRIATHRKPDPKTLWSRITFKSSSCQNNFDSSVFLRLYFQIIIGACPVKRFHPFVVWHQCSASLNRTSISMSSDLSKQKRWDDENNCLSLRHFFCLQTKC